MEKVLSAMDDVCKAYVQQLIDLCWWDDVPVTLRLMMNHTVRVPHEGGGPVSAYFNRVLKRREEDNRSHVHMLAVNYLQAFEKNLTDAQERQYRMDELKDWVGADIFKKAGHAVVAKLDGSCQGTVDVGERVHELFQPRYGDWYEGVRQGHVFLKKFCAAKEERKVSDVVSRLLLLIQSTFIPWPEPQPHQQSCDEEVRGYGAAEFSRVVADLRVLYESNEYRDKFGRSWGQTLKAFLHLKFKADRRLEDYLAQRPDFPAPGIGDPRGLLSRQIIDLLEKMLPGSGSAQARLAAVKASLPLARPPPAVGITHTGAADCGGEVGCLWASVGTEVAEEINPSLWAGVDACALYLGMLRQLHVLWLETPPDFQTRVLSLGSLVLQLARVCMWSAIADVGDGDLSRSSLVAFNEAYARVIKGDTDKTTSHLLDLAASLHLYRIVAFLRLRPIWGALDRLPQRDVADDADLQSFCKPLVDKLIGYEMVPRTEPGQGSYMDVVPVQGSYMDVVRRCVSMRSVRTVLLDHSVSPAACQWVNRWCAHAVGLASMLSHPSLGIMEDMSTECIEELLHTDLAFYSLHLFCDKESLRGGSSDVFMASES
jgi:hypothetical protein